jgi:hypothetical protein
MAQRKHQPLGTPYAGLSAHNRAVRSTIALSAHVYRAVRPQSSCPLNIRAVRARLPGCLPTKPSCQLTNANCAQCSLRRVIIVMIVSATAIRPSYALPNWGVRVSPTWPLASRCYQHSAIHAPFVVACTIDDMLMDRILLMISYLYMCLSCRVTGPCVLSSLYIISLLIARQRVRSGSLAGPRLGRGGGTRGSGSDRDSFSLIPSSIDVACLQQCRVVWRLQI